MTVIQKIISDHQIGFQSGKGTAEAVCMLIIKILSNLLDKIHSMVTFIDNKAAYDNEDSRILFDMLLIDVCSYLYTDKFIANSIKNQNNAE